MDALLAVEKEVERATSVFESFYENVDSNIDKQIDLVTNIVNDLSKIEDNQAFKTATNSSIQVCKEQIKDFIKSYSDKHKDLHANISKIGKVIDKNFVPEYGNLPQTNILDTNEKEMLLNQVICEHFLRSGHLDVTDSLIKEATLEKQCDESKKKPFIKMNFIISKIREKNLEPALDWCRQNTAELKAIKSPLEFNLHRLNFITFIQQGASRQIEALRYSRNFTPFAKECSKEIQRLMGSLLYINSGLENSPYHSYLSAELWDEIEEEFTKNACHLMGLAVECPLNISVHAGCKALPSLINIVHVMQQTQVTHILSKDELPIEIDIGSNHRYHSVFACPILRQQSTDLNPPMKLICGHVISKDALNKLNNTGKLKCPYCPIEQNPSDATQMFF